jgi:hypothetical protein
VKVTYPDQPGPLQPVRESSLDVVGVAEPHAVRLVDGVVCRRGGVTDAGRVEAVPRRVRPQIPPRFDFVGATRASSSVIAKTEFPSRWISKRAGAYG